jgi:ParB/RepB/Spo0J family partition protein
MDDIRQNGILQPLLVRVNPDPEAPCTYEIIAGERRWKAARRLKLDSVPCQLREADDASALLMALSENVSRHDLSPMEEAEAYERWTRLSGCAQSVLAQRLGVSQPTISNRIRLLQLPEAIRAAISGGQLSASHGVVLLQLANRPEEMEALGRQALEMSLSQAQLTALVKARHDELYPPHPELALTEATADDVLEAEASAEAELEERAAAVTSSLKEAADGPYTFILCGDQIDVFCKGTPVAEVPPALMVRARHALGLPSVGKATSAAAPESTAAEEAAETDPWTDDPAPAATAAQQTQPSAVAPAPIPAAAPEPRAVAPTTTPAPAIPEAPQFVGAMVPKSEYDWVTAHGWTIGQALAELRRLLTPEGEIQNG